jgi:hypothetical protein
LCAQVDGDDVGALFGEADRMRLTLTSGGTGNEGHFSVELLCHDFSERWTPDPDWAT